MKKKQGSRFPRGLELCARAAGKKRREVGIGLLDGRKKQGEEAKKLGKDWIVWGNCFGERAEKFSQTTSPSQFLGITVIS